MSIFHDQATFMKAAGNTYPECCTKDMLVLADTLVKEEFKELVNEVLSYVDTDHLNVNEVKETLDLIYVAAQKLNTLIGPDKALACWDALQANNMSKCVEGKLVKAENGKVLKPSGYKKLNLAPIVFSNLTLDL